MNTFEELLNYRVAATAEHLSNPERLVGTEQQLWYASTRLKYWYQSSKEQREVALSQSVVTW